MAFPTPNPVVEIGEVPPDSNDGVYREDEFNPYAPQNESVWNDYVITSRYHKSHRRYLLPITSVGGFSFGSLKQSCSVVQLAHPTLLWAVDWTASRFNSKPCIPRSEVADANWVLLDETLEPGQVIVGADGVVPLYRISGTYVYANLNPDKYLNRNVEFPLPGWIEKNKFDRTVPDGMFEDGLSNTKIPT